MIEHRNAVHGFADIDRISLCKCYNIAMFEEPQAKINAMEAGLDSILGKGGGNLVFQTFKRVYSIDKGHILDDRDKFESVIERIFGGMADNILRTIDESIDGKA